MGILVIYTNYLRITIPIIKLRETAIIYSCSLPVESSKIPVIIVQAPILELKLDNIVVGLPYRSIDMVFSDDGHHYQLASKILGNRVLQLIS